MRYSLLGRPIDRTVNNLLQEAAARRVALLGGTTTVGNIISSFLVGSDFRFKLRGH